MVLEQAVDHNGEAFGTALSKEIIVVNAVLCTRELLYPALYLAQPVIEAEAHEETDVQILLQTIVAGGQATGYVVSLQGKEEHVATMTEDGHVATLHHEAQVLKPGVD